MADQPGDPTTPDDKPVDAVEAKLAEIEKVRASLEADRASLAEEKQQTANLNQTMSNLADTIQQQNTPEPVEESLPEDFDENTLRAAGIIAKRQLEAYHNELMPVLTDVQVGQFTSEWERVKASDPKNFARMETSMKDYFDKNPTQKVVGAVENLFVKMRGTHYTKLQEMDRAERQQDTTIDPNPTTMPRKGAKEADKDTLSDEQWGVVKGLGVTPEHYYMGQHGRKPDFADGYIEDHGYKKEA